MTLWSYTAELDGKFYAFDENGNKVDFSKTGYIFGYDGTEKKFKEVKFVPTANTLKLVEGKDYEIKYFNNITVFSSKDVLLLIFPKQRTRRI